MGKMVTPSVPPSYRDMSTSTEEVDVAEPSYQVEQVSSADIPQETEDLVVVPALSSQLDEPIGTIVVKSIFDTTFPPRLKGLIDSDSFLVRKRGKNALGRKKEEKDEETRKMTIADFKEKMTDSNRVEGVKTTIEVINWFLELRLYAETEKHSRTYELSQTWKRLYSKYAVDRKRQEIIRQYCVDNRLVCPFYRDYTFTAEEFEQVERKLLEALHLFIDDENRNYIPKGWYWTYPENHGWLWMEFRRLAPNESSLHSSSPSSSLSTSPASSALGQMLKQRLISSPPNVPIPPTPEWDLDIKITILHALKVDTHTEYLIYIENNLGKWTPHNIVYALKRYNDFLAFYQQLTAFIRIHSLDASLPPFPEKDLIQSKSSVNKRVDSFQALLTYIAEHPDLFASPPVLKFFNVHPCPVAWRGLPYVKRTFLGIYN